MKRLTFLQPPPTGGIHTEKSKYFLTDPFKESLPQELNSIMTNEVFSLKLQFLLVAKLKAHGYIPTDTEHAMSNAFKFSYNNKSTKCK